MNDRSGAAAKQCDVVTSRKIALIGMPNTGKSTLYNCLTRGNAHIANWPGLTVEIISGSIAPDRAGNCYELLDLPGIHDLIGSSEDEAIVNRFLRTTPPDVVLMVVNATQLSSQLRLLLQLSKIGVPLVVALNMWDEAVAYGIEIDCDGLATELKIPILPVVAKRNKGINALIKHLHEVADSLPLGATGYAAGLNLSQEIEDERQAILVEKYIKVPAKLRNYHTRKLDAILLHPLVGVLLFLASVLLIFQLLYALATPLQEWLGFVLDWFETVVLSPGLSAIAAPELLQSFVVKGIYLGVSTLATFLPLIFLFYLMIGIIEDSGYLPRAAYLMDGFMHWLGLDGRSFVLQVMGFGCNVPSIMGTRVIRDRSQRLLAMLVIPFALCQARLTVYVFMAGVFFPRPWWAPGTVLFAFYLLSFVAAIVTGLIFKNVYPSKEVFILELPPYRSPSLATVLRRGWTSMLSFFVTTRAFIVYGAAGIWLLTNLPPGAKEAAGNTFAGLIGAAFQPLLAPIGMNPALTVSLFFGFIAKEILLGAMAVIYGSGEANLGTVIGGAITPLQSLSFMTFVLIYTPCLGTVAAQLKESRSRNFVLLSVSWSLSLAWVMALVVYQGGKLIIELA
jgi:ferrous iron transport protein B